MVPRCQLPLALIGWLVFMCQGTSTKIFAQNDDFENEPINYSHAEATDPVAQLKEKLDKGELTWGWDEKFGFLPSLLQTLKVPIESQVLVFSKTSLQIHKISPTNPRALYFNDSVYIGYVPGSRLLELAANDVRLGAVFYTLDAGNDDEAETPRIVKLDTQQPSSHEPPLQSKQDSQFTPRLLRDKGQCLACHATSRTSYVPGYLVRSIYSDTSGRARTGTGTYVTDYRSPFEQRWGGWYVTGTHGTMRHMGNVFAIDRNDPEEIDREKGANQIELPKIVSASNYLGPHSDIVALMVLEHQARVHNLITRASFETRSAIFQDEAINKAIDREPSYRSETTQRRIARASQELLEALMYVDELDLDASVEGTSAFAKMFEQRTPRAINGDSLFQLDRKSRLFRFPLSYLIYTPEFSQLPEPVLDLIRIELDKLLNGAPNEGSKIQLSEDDRRRLSMILKETKPELLIARP